MWTTGVKGFDTLSFVIYQCVITVITVYQNFTTPRLCLGGCPFYHRFSTQLWQGLVSCQRAALSMVRQHASLSHEHLGLVTDHHWDAGCWIWLPTMFLVFYIISLRLFKESSQPPIMRGLFLCVCMCTVYRYTRAWSRIRRSNINTSTCSLGLLKIVCCPFHHCFELLPFWRDKFSLHSLKSPISMFHRVGIDTYCADGILELISILQLCSQGHRFSRAQDSSSSNVLPSSVATHFALKSAESSALGIRQQGNPPEKF